MGAQLVEILLLASRNLVRNARRTLLSGATVALGVATILFCKAYVDGLERMILEFVIDAREGALQVQRRGYGESRELASLTLDLPEHGAVRDRLATDPDVAAVAPRIRFVGLASNGQTTVALSALGVDPASEAAVCPRGPGAHAPELVGPGLASIDAEQVVLGRGLAEALRLDVGSQVTLLVQTRGGSLDTVDVEVAGTYRFPDPAEDKHLAVVPLAIAQRLLHVPGRVTTFAIATRQKGVRAIDAAVAEIARTTAGSDPPVEVHPWHELSPYFRDVITLEGQLMTSIVTIVFVLVVAGVVNTMLMSVLERTREIGTLMALGLRRRRILTLFLFESVLLCGAAAMIGAWLGWILVALAARHGIAFDLPGAGLVRIFPRFAARYIAWAALAALAGGIAGGLIPARRASSTNPITALRS